jgi:hypothetical protein
MERERPLLDNGQFAPENQTSKQSSGKTASPPPFKVTAGPVQAQQHPQLPPLTSPRFKGVPQLEAVASGAKTLDYGDKGHGVYLINQCLYDLGYDMSHTGIVDTWGAETNLRIKKFRKDQGLDGSKDILDWQTLYHLDMRFAAVKLNKKKLGQKWSPQEVKAILEPWSPKTIKALQNEIDLYTMDANYTIDEEWDGKKWVKEKMDQGGYRKVGTKEIGIINDTNENVAETLYHEVMHFYEPRHGVKGTLQEETYAYRATEEFTIAMGMEGRPENRSQYPNGRQFADPKKVEAEVLKDYPGISRPASKKQSSAGQSSGQSPNAPKATRGKKGTGPERILRKGKKFGTVVVQPLTGGASYTRKARKGEKIAGKDSKESNKKKIDRKVWK